MKTKDTLEYLLQSPPLHKDVRIVSSRIDANGDLLIVRSEPCIYHPQGGGQKGDRGLLAGVCVVDARKTDDGDVDIFVEKAGIEFIKPGSVAEAIVDSHFRQANACLHTSGHLLAHIVQKRYPGLQAIGGHHWPGEARVSFEGTLEVSTEEFLRVIQSDLALAVGGHLPVIVVGDPFNDRAIQIGDFAPPIACGGTHLSSTGSIGCIAIRKIKRDGKGIRVSYDAALSSQESDDDVLTAFAD